MACCYSRLQPEAVTHAASHNSTDNQKVRKSPMPPPCHCFSLCEQSDVLDFHARLPIVHNKSSRWIPYLRAIYGSISSFPIDLSELNVIYPALLPAAHTCGLAFRPCGMTNESDECSGWLRPGPPAKSPWRKVMRTYPNTSAHAIIITTWYQGFPWARNFGSLPASNHSWTEVTRVASRKFGYKRKCYGEGRGYGCWFTRLRGTGIFVNTGRTKVIKKRQWSNLVNDCAMANNTARQGFDSLQILSNDVTKGAVAELIVASPSCMFQPEVLPGPCVPLALRTGVRAETNCQCDDAQHMINCAAGSMHHSLRAPELVAQGRPPVLRPFFNLSAFPHNAIPIPSSWPII